MTLLPVIPVMLCFNDNYSIPGMVAIYTLLKTASRKYHYNIHILHSDISKRHQEQLNSLVNRFPDCELFLHDMGGRFKETFERVAFQSYWSCEIFYKCITPSFFPQYDRIVITDADVVFCRDFTTHWTIFLQDKKDYLGGYSCLIKKKLGKGEKINQPKKRKTNLKKREILTGAGFWFQNLKLMREYQIENQFISYIAKYVKKLMQPEQEVVNYVCWPKIRLLPPEGMIIAWDYEHYRTHDDFNMDCRYSAKEVQYALKHPIQLHYAGSLKPWNALFVKKASKWWWELAMLGKPSVFFEGLRLLQRRMMAESLKIKARKLIASSTIARYLYKAWKCLQP